ncbi:MAG: hypothetical protein SH868_09360 [Bythopirellula sp.]|nr:hypothetical protein [Bythopirellula sp.]
MSHADPENPATGDMFRCEKCDFEVQVTKECDCDPPCHELKCCGQLMKNVTSLEVPSSVGN